MQRLLVEGMKLVHDGLRSASPEADARAEAEDVFPIEAYGHLAAALRPLMVEATDERLGSLASKRFFPAIAHALNLGAGGLWSAAHIASACAYFHWHLLSYWRLSTPAQ